MDKITGINTTALDGIRFNLQGLQEAAHEIATAPVERAEPTELAEPLVKMLEAQRAIEASMPSCCGGPTTRSTAYSTRCAPERVRRVRLPRRAEAIIALWSDERRPDRKPRPSIRGRDGDPKSPCTRAVR